MDKKGNVSSKWLYKGMGILLIALSILIWTGNVTAFAQTPNPEIPDDDVNDIAKQMFCPVCENIPLDVCGTQACSQWRELIRLKLSEGWTEDQIKQYFVDQYGDRVLAEPPREGLNWLVYILPPITIVLGFLAVLRVLSSWRKPAIEQAGKAAASQPVHEDEYMNRLEEELRKRK